MPYACSWKAVYIASYMFLCVYGVQCINLQLCCIVIAASTTEFTSGWTECDYAAKLICYENPKVEHSDHRICHSLMAAAISSILVAMFLMNFDVFIPCMGKMVTTIIIRSYVRMYVPTIAT